MKTKTFKFTFDYSYMPTEFEIEAKDGNVAFNKAIKTLKEQIEDQAFSGDLTIDDGDEDIDNGDEDIDNGDEDNE